MKSNRNRFARVAINAARAIGRAAALAVGVCGPMFAHGQGIAVEKVFVADFEEQPVEVYPRIEFVTDQTQLFAESGETRSASVRVYDASGNLIADPDLDWTSSNGSLLSVTETGPGEAELTSLGSWDGTVTFQAAYPALGLTIAGQATMADPAPDTVLIPSAWVLEVLGDRFNEHTVVLERNGTTQGLGADDIVVSGDAAGVSVRVLAAELAGDRVRLEVIPASVEEAFEAYSSAAAGEPVRVMIRAREASTRVTTYSRETGRVLGRQALPSRSLLNAVTCDGDLDLGTNVRFDALDLEIDLQPKTESDINLFGDDFLELGMSGSVRAVAQLSVSASADAPVAGKCSVDLRNIVLPDVRLYIFRVAPRIDPSIEVRASATAQAATGWVPISGLERTWTLDAGIRYTTAGGWESFETFDSSGAEPDGGSFTLGGDLALEATAGVNVGAGLDFCLTPCAPNTGFANTEFIQLFGGPYWRFGIATPLDPADPAYQGPELSIGVDAEATAGLEVSFFESGILKYLPIGGSAGFSFPIFSQQLEFVSTPGLSGSLQCAPDCGAMPTDGGTLDLQLTAAAAGTGTAEFWMGRSGAMLSLLGTAAFDGGQASASFAPGSLVEGTYEVYPRLALDSALFWFTPTWPLGAQTPVGQFTVDAGVAAPPPTPSAPNASDGAYSDRVEITWSSADGADDYDVYRCDTTARDACGTAIATVASTDYADTGGDPGTTYYYRLRACSAADGCSGLSDYDAGRRQAADGPTPGETFTDCADCPTMVQIPAGTFTQGSPPDEPGWDIIEGPQRTVDVPAFAMGQTEVTFDQWDACVADGGCSHNPDDEGWGRGDRPVIRVSWNDAQEYVTWLSNKTGEDYRLPSESEWEYATRAGTTGRFNTGECITTDQANFYGVSPPPAPFPDCPAGEYRAQTVPVASFAPNAFGLYDTHGNVWEWVQDCWNGYYDGAPTDGSAWMTGDCSRAMVRGGSWDNPGTFLRSANRAVASRDYRGSDNDHYGFRVARSVSP